MQSYRRGLNAVLGALLVGAPLLAAGMGALCIPLAHGAATGGAGTGGAAAAGAETGGASSAAGAPGLEVLKIVLAQRDVPLGGQQLVQVTLRNAAGKGVRAGLRVELRSEKDTRVGKPIDRVTQVRAQDQQREFFRFSVPPRPGKYTVRMEVFTPDYRHKLLPGDPVFFSPFTVGLEPVVESPKVAPSAPGGKTPVSPPSFAPPAGLSFEKPDLVWENLDVQPINVLLGEPLKVKADLRNVGGDIARTIDVQAEYYNLRTPGRREKVSRTSVLVLAPGDKVEMEFEVVFPEETQLGEYAVLLQIDPDNKLSEASRENNVAVSETPINVTQIKLVFPQPGFAFDQAGLFLFRWDSRKFDEFKVQVGTDPNFLARDSFFDLPQGGKWSNDHEIVPLEGELPDMGLGLMQKNKAAALYWRVIGRNAAGNDGRSLVQSFVIRPEGRAQGARTAAPESPGERSRGAAQTKKDTVAPPRAVQPSQSERPSDAPKALEPQAPESGDQAEKPEK